MFNVDYDKTDAALSLHYWSSFISDKEAKLMEDTAVQTVTSLLDNLSGTVAGHIGCCRKQHFTKNLVTVQPGDLVQLTVTPEREIGSY
ncbi:hypothetical protein BJX62DRAFT_206325 [Aspergillus germanicus]